MRVDEGAEVRGCYHVEAHPLLGAMTALTSFSDERRFFPRRVFEERQDFAAMSAGFFPRRVFEERGLLCEELPFF